MDEETKLKISKTLKEKHLTHSLEWRDKMSKLFKGRVSPMKGRHHTEETKGKLRKINLGKKLSEESVRKLKEHHKGFLGYHHTEEAKLKITRALKGRKIIIKHPPGVYSAKEAGKNGRCCYVRTNCIVCGKEKWTKYTKFKKGLNKMCMSCAIKKAWKTSAKVPRSRGSKSALWKGGRALVGGYVRVYILPENKWLFPDLGKKVYVLEHRLAMAKFLNRPLKPNEIVHHINGDKTNNKIENLQLLDRKIHKIKWYEAYQEGYKKGYADAEQKYNKD